MDTILDLMNNLYGQDRVSLDLVVAAHDERKHGKIEFAGFNTSSGYVYLALENCISICSCFAQDVVFLVTDFETGEEFFYDTYEEAEAHENN